MTTSKESCNFYQAQIFIGGNMTTIEEACAEYCEKGFCVSIKPAMFVYTGGRESGAEITIINYARFPRDPDEIDHHATELAKMLLLECHQASCSVVTPRTSYYMTKDSIKK